MDLETGLKFAGFFLTLFGFVFALGRLFQRVNTHEVVAAEIKGDVHEIRQTITAINTRLSDGDCQIAVLKDLTARVDGILGNGVVRQIDTLKTDVAVMKQHCLDMHKGKAKAP